MSLRRSSVHGSLAYRSNIIFDILLPPRCSEETPSMKVPPNRRHATSSILVRVRHILECPSTISKSPVHAVNS